MTVENISIDVKTNAGDAANQFRSLSSAINGIQSAASQAQSANNGTAQSIKNVGNAAKKASEGGLSNFLSSLKRIAMYRALRSIIKAITQAIKEGMDNLYEFSKANGDFGGIASAFDGLASAAQTMKNQLGATFGQMLAAASPILIALMNLVTKLAEAFYPLVNAIAALEPVITGVINVISSLIDIIISLFDLLGFNVGKIVAQDATAEWKEAKKAAGDYKNTILGFDEINRLNGPSGGGGGTTGGNRFEISEKDFQPFKFDWLDTLIGKINDAKTALAELVAELVGVPDSVLVDIFVKDRATEPLQGLVRTVQESFPVYATVVMAIEGNPIPLIQKVRSAVINFARESVGAIRSWQTAYATACASVNAESYSLAGSLQTIFANITGTIHGWQAAYAASCAAVSADSYSLASNFQDVFTSITETVNAWETNYSNSVDNVMVENATLGQDVQDTFNRMKNPLNEWVSHFWEKVGEYQTASGALQTENATLASDIAMTYANIQSNVSSALANAKSNIITFATETLPQWGTWAQNVADNARLSFENVAQNAYLGLQSAADNIASFVNSTASNVASWVTTTASNIANWATNVASNVGRALSSAWENFKNFMTATGEAISGWWSENKTWAIPAAVGVTVAVAAVALAPFTGGASLAGLALAADGGMFPNTGSLIWAGEAGPEIVANMGNKTGVMNVDQMEAAVANGNINVVNAVYAMANAVVKAVNDKDTDITLDGQSLADKMYRYNQQAANRYGVAMVT